MDDSERILSCLLEEARDHVAVHYRKLKLAPMEVESALRRHDLTVQVGAGPRREIVLYESWVESYEPMQLAPIRRNLRA